MSAYRNFTPVLAAKKPLELPDPPLSAAEIEDKWPTRERTYRLGFDAAGMQVEVRLTTRGCWRHHLYIGGKYFKSYAGTLAAAKVGLRHIESVTDEG